MIAFKQFDTLAEVPNLHPRLREVLNWLVDRWPDPYMEITRIYDPPVSGESGIHRTTPHRAADIRTNDLPASAGLSMERRVNAAWDYGKAPYRVALQHGQGANRHLHVQVRDETHKRG